MMTTLLARVRERGGSFCTVCDNESVSTIRSKHIVFFADGVRIREERRREATKNLSSRRSSTDSSEDGFNLNVRDLKVRKSQ